MKSQNILYIDTSDSKVTTVRITRSETIHEFKEETNTSTRSQNVLMLIEKTLKAAELKLTDLTQVEVHPGPGSFTGVRVGISVANALGFALGIPVNGKKQAIPLYASSKFDS